MLPIHIQNHKQALAETCNLLEFDYKSTSQSLSPMVDSAPDASERFRMMFTKYLEDVQSLPYYG